LRCPGKKVSDKTDAERFKISKNHVFQVSRFQGFQIARFQDFEDFRVEVLSFPAFKVSGIQGSKLSRFKFGVSTFLGTNRNKGLSIDRN
jgi:hypothetical protein